MLKGNTRRSLISSPTESCRIITPQVKDAELLCFATYFSDICSSVNPAKEYWWCKNGYDSIPGYYGHCECASFWSFSAKPALPNLDCVFIKAEKASDTETSSNTQDRSRPSKSKRKNAKFALSNARKIVGPPPQKSMTLEDAFTESKRKRRP